jgi:hypothetical protein
MPKSIKRKRGGELSNKNVNECKYNVNDANARVNSEDPYEIQGVYNKCCPKSTFGFKNPKPFCKNLAKQYTMLQQAKNFGKKQIFTDDNDRFADIENKDYYKHRNAITNPNENIEKGEFSKEFQETNNKIGGKSRKTRKTRKSRRVRKTRKSRK